MAERDSTNLSRQKRSQRARHKENGDKKKKKSGRGVSVFSWGTVLVIAFIAGTVGAMAGYQLLGGQPASEVLQLGTWKHLLDLIFG
jgi:cytochrome c-type biogenesis protein CcmH/NrfG